jgi:GINS complex subunit 1
MCWKGEDVLDTADGGKNGEEGRDGSRSTGNGNGIGSQNSLSSEEEEYIRQYGEMLATYKGQWTDIDLTGSLEPPRDLFIDVRVLKDAGEIQTEYGYVLHFVAFPTIFGAWRSVLSIGYRAINLTKNSQFYVRQGDVERLIAQGFLQRLDWIQWLLFKPTDDLPYHVSWFKIETARHLKIFANGLQLISENVVSMQ